MLIGAGGAPRTAIAMGQGDKEQAEKIISNSFTMLMIFAVLLTVVFYASAPTLLRLFGASDTTLPYALAYSRIYILGSVCVLMVMGMNPFITTQGFAKISMLTTVIGAVINIILDPILIFAFGLGVQGAAIATVLSQAVGAIWILRFLTGPKTTLKLKKRVPEAGKEDHPARRSAGHILFRHALHRESALHQLQLQPRPVRRRRGRGRYDGHHQRFPAGDPAPSGHLPRRPAGDELQLRRGQKRAASRRPSASS